MNRLILCTSCLAFLSLNIHAAGTTSAGFLKIGMDAKNAAMGDTGTAGDGSNSVNWNPAGLTGATGREISFSHIGWLDEINLEAVYYTHGFSSSTIGVSASYLSMPALYKYDNTGLKENETFSPSDMLVSLSYAFHVAGVPAGVRVKYLSSQLDDVSASAVAADIGIIFYKSTFKDGKSIRAGAMIQNMGTPLKFYKESFPLPFGVKLGAKYSFVENACLAADVNPGNDTGSIFNLGGEYVFSFEDVLLAARAGFKSELRFTSGVGFEYKNITLDYAFVPYGELDNTHRISIRYGF
ncbi:MAG: hypothetical protein A2219_00410 [Elusimicrobia bacterium RIFOXYA2_FULL_50_26]|nr:MAG: hypothetical protein A2219_00410 [Elusimicrobia bacterium RIFOXYA2_FULL_50_26]OGS24612.1 MAG: hypothetical protein A2314_04620 [Elusimicrobia bacterium RIFOXYB2_FULL_50_12]